MTITHTTISQLQADLASHRFDQTIALVPTMGNLHAGHIELVKQAKLVADVVVVSIFVNPTQFGANEDLSSYPRTLAADTQALQKVQTDYIFAPCVAEMYPVMPPPTLVLAGDISQKLCGLSRPTHFDGVGLVVCKLFNIVRPDVAVFGKKDHQQLAIIRQLVRDLSYHIDIVGVPIVRAKDGLALSSRNRYLTEHERRIAPMLNQELNVLADKLKTWQRRQGRTVDQLHSMVEHSKQRLQDFGFVVDYLTVKQADLTDVVDTSEHGDRQQLIILTAAKLGKARLLDNVEVL